MYNVPQIVHIYKTKSVKDISMLSMGMRFISYFLYIIHVWIKRDWALFYTYCLGILQVLTMLIQIHWYKSKCNSIKTYEKGPPTRERRPDTSSSDDDV